MEDYEYTEDKEVKAHRISALITLIIAAVIIGIFSSCNPQKRIVRIAEKYNLKQFKNIVYKDTIYIPEKTYIFETQTDTAGLFYYKTDTITVEGQVKENTVYIRFTTKPDTVYIEKPITIETIKVQKVEKKKGFSFGNFACIAWVVLFLYVIWNYIKRRYEKK